MRRKSEFRRRETCFFRLMIIGSILTLASTSANSQESPLPLAMEGREFLADIHESVLRLTESLGDLIPPDELEFLLIRHKEIALERKLHHVPLTTLYGPEFKASELPFIRLELDVLNSLYRQRPLPKLKEAMVDRILNRVVPAIALHRYNVHLKNNLFKRGELPFDLFLANAREQTIAFLNLDTAGDIEADLLYTVETLLIRYCVGSIVEPPRYRFPLESETLNDSELQPEHRIAQGLGIRLIPWKEFVASHLGTVSSIAGRMVQRNSSLSPADLVADGLLLALTDLLNFNFRRMSYSNFLKRFLPARIFYKRNRRTSTEEQKRIERVVQVDDFATEARRTELEASAPSALAIETATDLFLIYLIHRTRALEAELRNKITQFELKELEESIFNLIALPGRRTIWEKKLIELFPHCGNRCPPEKVSRSRYAAQIRNALKVIISELRILRIAGCLNEKDQACHGRGREAATARECGVTREYVRQVKKTVWERVTDWMRSGAYREDKDSEAMVGAVLRRHESNGETSGDDPCLRNLRAIQRATPPGGLRVLE